MTSEADTRRAADALVGQVLAGITYVGLTYEDPSSAEWDFGDWHWPEVGVELRTGTGDLFTAIWDSKVTHFELTFKQGPISSEWSPLRDEPDTARIWDVSRHPRWAPFVGGVVSAYDLMTFAPDDPPILAPVGIRLTGGNSIAWIVAAAPRETASARPDLTARDVYLGHDEGIVVFGDERAQILGLRANG